MLRTPPNQGHRLDQRHSRLWLPQPGFPSSFFTTAVCLQDAHWPHTGQALQPLELIPKRDAFAPDDQERKTENY